MEKQRLGSISNLGRKVDAWEENYTKWKKLKINSNIQLLHEIKYISHARSTNYSFFKMVICSSSKKRKNNFLKQLIQSQCRYMTHLSPSFVCILSTCWTTSIPFPPDRERNCFCVCFTVQLGGCSAFLSTFSASCCCNLSLEHLGPKAKRKGEAKRGATGWWVVPGETKFTTNQKKLMQIHCMVN